MGEEGPIFWVGGWMDGWIDGWMDGWTDGFIDDNTKVQINKFCFQVLFRNRRNMLPGFSFINFISHSKR